MASYNRKNIDEITKSPLSKKEDKVVKKDKRRKPTKMEMKNRIKKGNIYWELFMLPFVIKPHIK
ncbi:hypothetical protein [Serratia fonticola]|uniref:Uncharacterized protein n=1 Tax=Serratia fonticola TaxID=47917 RepID=A0ABY9PJC3_SERFO|nr:hypothetical protein [Serratia fonticola]WMT13510.1 hypothetical protein RFB13_20135 [Serratia fonticola]